MDAGNQYKLPAIAPPDTPPCTGFSVGDDGDGTKIPKVEECLGDLIRIPGKNFFKLFKKTHPMLTHRITYQLKIFVYAFSYSNVGASPECCQGSRPTATADAYCGWILNIDNAQVAKSSIPLCGELGLKKLGY